MNIKKALAAAAAGALSGCAIAPPASPTSMDDPSNPCAREAPAHAFRPALVKTTKTFISTHVGADASEMRMGGMDEMDGAGDAGRPKNAAEKVTQKEVSAESAPTGEQLQSLHPTGYTCPMHPQIKSAESGKCPICGMTLVSMETVEKTKAVQHERSDESHSRD